MLPVKLLDPRTDNSGREPSQWESYIQAPGKMGWQMDSELYNLRNILKILIGKKSYSLFLSVAQIISIQGGRQVGDINTS